MDLTNQGQKKMSENDWRRGRATMATVITTARFIRNFRIYIQTHGWDLEFKDEVMFVMCDPQCHPPKTDEQFAKWMDLTL